MGTVNISADQRQRPDDQNRRGDGISMSLPELLGRVHDAARGERVSVGNVVDAFGPRAYGPMFFVVGLVMVSPLGAIPGAPALSAVLIMLIAVQMTFRHRAPWLPKRLRAVSGDSRRFNDAVDRIEPWLDRLAVIARPRYRSLLRRPAPLVLAAVHVMLAASMFPLGLVPFGVLAPALVVMVLGLAQATDDGLLATLAGGAALAVAIATATQLPLP